MENLQPEWLAAASALQLRASADDDGLSMYGLVGGVPIRVAFTNGGEQSVRSEASMTLVAGGDGRIPDDLDLRLAPSWRQLGRALGDIKGKTGDPRFDERLALPTLSAYGCAALSEPAREQLMALAAAGAHVSNGFVRWELRRLPELDRGWLVTQIERIAGVAAQLGVTSDTLVQRLAHGAVHDSCSGVRLQNLSFLAASETRAPHSAIALAARALLADSKGLIRFEAARLLGQEGHPALHALATESEQEPELRARALRELHEQDAAGVEELLAPLLTASPTVLVQAALSVVASRRLSDHVDPVMRLTTVGDPTLRAAAARALGSLESASIEPCLLRLLGDQEIGVQTAAAASLAAVGSVRAVEPLLLLTKGLARGELRQAARGAIARIQTRLGDVEAGRLMLASGEDLVGAIAIAEGATGGELSLTGARSPSPLPAPPSGPWRPRQ